MSYLVDTCGWIEWLTDGVLADEFAPFLQEASELIIPTTLQFELYKWAKREKGEVMAIEAIALTEQAKVIPLTTSLSLTAADIALKHKLSFADAIIYATAQQHDVLLITADDHFEHLADVTYFSKKLLNKH